MGNSVKAREYELSFEQRPGYLYAYVRGVHDSYAISKAYWQEVVDRMIEGGDRRVLIDEDIEEAASELDVYQLVLELPAMGFTGKRVAFYDRKAEHKDLNDFGELVASNRGMNARVFNDIDAAEKWLMSA